MFGHLEIFGDLDTDFAIDPVGVHALQSIDIAVAVVHSESLLACDAYWYRAATPRTYLLSEPVNRASAV